MTTYNNSLREVIDTSDTTNILTTTNFDSSFLDEPIASDVIKRMDSAQLVDCVVSCFDLERIERVRALALIQIRAAELGIERQVEKLIKQYESIDRKMERDYRRQRANDRLKMQLKLDGKGEPMPTIEKIMI